MLRDSTWILETSTWILKSTSKGREQEKDIDGEICKERLKGAEYFQKSFKQVYSRQIHAVYLVQKRALLFLDGTCLESRATFNLRFVGIILFYTCIVRK
jgi:hypothetical protein